MASPARVAVALGALAAPFAAAALWTGWHASRSVVELAGDSASLLTALPSTLRVGPIPVGAVVPVSFTVHNRSDRVLTLAPIEASCGCLNLRYGLPMLAAGGLTEVTGSVQVQEVGTRVATVRVGSTAIEDPGTSVRIEVVGSPAPRIEPRVIEAREPIEGRSEISAIVVPSSCFESAQDVQIRFTGKLMGDASVSAREDGAWDVSGRVWPARSAVYGVLEGALEVTGQSCPGLTSSSTVLLEIPPPECPASWPSLRKVLSLPESSPWTLTLPDTTIKSAADIGGLPHRVRTEIVPGDSGDAIRVWVEGAGESGSGDVLRLELETSRGLLWVRAIVLPARSAGAREPER